LFRQDFALQFGDKFQKDDFLALGKVFFGQVLQSFGEFASTSGATSGFIAFDHFDDVVLFVLGAFSFGT